MTYTEIKECAREMRSNPTSAESFFWEKVRRRKILGFRFNRQFVIRHELEYRASKKYFIADFYCHKRRLIIEVDGGYHDSQKEYDNMRDEMLSELGYTVKRYSNEDVMVDWSNVEKDLLVFLQ